MNIKDKDKYIEIKFKMRVSNNPHGIPPGTIIDVYIRVEDEYELIRTTNAQLTRDLIKVIPPVTTAKYNPKLQASFINYPNKTKAEILKIVLEDIKKLPKI